MHLTQVAFLALFLATLTAAFARGERAERVGGAMLLGAALATPLVQTRMFTGVEYGVAAIDLTLLGALVWLAFNHDRRWLVYAASFQAVGVLTHVARLKAGPVHGDVYGYLLVLWSYPVLLSLLWGSFFEARQKPLAAVAAPQATDGVWARRQPAPTPEATHRSDGDEDAVLLARLLALHDLGPESMGVARKLLTRTGSLGAALAIPPARLRSWGFDGRVAEALAFAKIMTRTSLKRRLEARVKIDNVQDTLDYLHSELAHLPHEQVRILYLNGRNRLIFDEVHGVGTVNMAPVYPREVIKRAMETGAVKLVLAHNHPSGDPSPSRDDIVMTKAIIEAGRHVGVGVLDHLIVSATGHVSMKETGLI